MSSSEARSLRRACRRSSATHLCLVQTPEALAAFVVPPSADPYCLERGVDSVSDGHGTDGRRGPTTELGPRMSVGTHKLVISWAPMEQWSSGSAAVPACRDAAGSGMRSVSRLTPVPGLPGGAGRVYRSPFRRVPAPRSKLQAAMYRRRSRTLDHQRRANPNE